MNPFGQYDLSPAGAGGYFASESRVLSTIAQTETEYPHVYGRPPDYLAMVLTCIVTDNNWSPGESWVMTQQTNTASQGVVLVATPSKLVLRWQGNNAGNMVIPDRNAGGGSGGAVNTASWRFQLVAYWFPRI